MAKSYLDLDGLKYYHLKLKAIFDEKVDKEYKTGSQSDYKVLSDNNFSDADKQNLADAVKVVPQSLDEAKKKQARDNIGAGTSNFSGNYSDLIGAPDIPEGVAPSDTVPKMNGTATVGVETQFSRGDHVHPTDTTRAASDHVHGAITNDGKIGSEAGKVVTTGAQGVIQTSNLGDLIVTFSVAELKAQIETTDSLTAILGKIAKWYASFGDAAWKNVGTGADNVAAGDHTHTPAGIGAIPASEKGQANGVATLGSDGLIPSSQLPSYVDDVVDGYYNSSDGEFYKEAEFTTEITGEQGKIYLDLTNPTNPASYRYSGSAFVKITSTDIIPITTGEIDQLFVA